MGSGRTTMMTAHSCGENTIYMGSYMGSGKGTTKTAPSGGDSTIITGRNMESGSTTLQTAHLCIKDTYLESNDTSS